MLCARGSNGGKLINWIGKRVVGSCTELSRFSKGIKLRNESRGESNQLVVRIFLSSIFSRILEHEVIIQIGLDISNVLFKKTNPKNLFLFDKTKIPDVLNN